MVESKNECVRVNIALVNKHLFYRSKGQTECGFISGASTKTNKNINVLCGAGQRTVELGNQ